MTAFPRDLTDAEVAAYQRDGVAHVPGCVDPAWLPRLTELVEATLRDPGPNAGDSNPGQATDRTFSDRHLWPHHDGFRAFAFDGGMGRIAGQAMGAARTRLYFDHIFVKEPGTSQGTPWHQDLPYWPFTGRQICTVWLTLQDVDAHNGGLRFVRGSHVGGKWYRPTSLSSKAEWIGSSDQEPIPDFDAEPDRYRFQSFDLRAGDALVFSAAIVHGSHPNTTAARRRLALATRWLGDDARWDPRPGTDPIVGPEDVSLAAGDLAKDDDCFPVVWERTGGRAS